MLKFYFNGSPNPSKVALFLEEAGLPYEPMPVDTRKGDQFAPEFLKVNPNAKVPVIVDGDVVVFDSNAILLYLAEKTGSSCPVSPTARAELLSWLMFVATGIGPFSGQAVHFKHFAPEKSPTRTIAISSKPSGISAFSMLALLSTATWSATPTPSSTWPSGAGRAWSRSCWVRTPGRMPNLKRLLDEISARPAAVRALALKDKHTFKTEMDDDARRHMFKHLSTATG